MPKYIDLTPFRSFGCWELEVSRKQLTSGTCEMWKNEILKQSHQQEFQILGFGGVKSQDSSSQESQRVEMWNVENPEIGTSIGVLDTRSWRSQESRLFITGVPKCRNAKCQKSWNRHINQSFGYQELEESRVETLHHRSLEVVKWKTPIILGFVTWSVEILLHRNAEM